VAELPTRHRLESDAQHHALDLFGPQLQRRKHIQAAHRHQHEQPADPLDLAEQDIPERQVPGDGRAGCGVRPGADAADRVAGGHVLHHRLVPQTTVQTAAPAEVRHALPHQQRLPTADLAHPHRGLRILPVVQVVQDLGAAVHDQGIEQRAWRPLLAVPLWEHYGPHIQGALVLVHFDLDLPAADHLAIHPLAHLESVFHFLYSDAA